MSKIVAIGNPAQLRAGAGPATRRALTPVWPVEKQTTNVRPVSAPWTKQRPEGWDMFSLDGLWHYQRYETGKATNWRVIFLPTGQMVEGYPAKNDGRADTAAGLQERLAIGAFSLALRSRLDDPDRAQGHRWLATHMRVSGKSAGVEADHRCECGGFLAVVTRGGDLAHVDACDRCYRYGRGLPAQACVNAAGHRFCGDPRVAGVFNGCGLWRELCCPTSCRPA